MDNIKFSIIIPAYNAEKYINQTINSIHKQTYTNYEIIVIDDASTDNTLKEVKKYDDIIILQNERNMRQGAARNKGLELATGDYIFFLDADDTFYTNDVLEKLVNLIKKENADIIYTGMDIQGRNKRFQVMPTKENSTKEVRLTEYEYANVCSICWKRKFVEENHIRFPEGISYEDVYFYFLGISKCKTYSIADFISYQYIPRENGTTTKKSFKQAIDTIYLIEHLTKLKEIIEPAHIPYLLRRIEQQKGEIATRIDRVLKNIF